MLVGMILTAAIVVLTIGGVIRHVTKNMIDNDNKNIRK